MNNSYQPLGEGIKKLFKRDVKILIFRPKEHPTDPRINDVHEQLKQEGQEIRIGTLGNWARDEYGITDNESAPFKARIYREKNKNKYLFELIELSENCLISRKGLMNSLIPIKKGDKINLRSNTTIVCGEPNSINRVEITFSNPLTVAETLLRGPIYFILFFVSIILILCLLVLYEIPRVPEFALPQSIEIQSSDKEQLLVTTADIITEDGDITTSYRLFVPIEKTGKYLYRAVIASEDRFFENNNVGVDGISILRAAFINLSKFDIVEGASTIHQQVISSSGIVPKTYINKRDLNPYRKIREIAAAIKLAQTVSTDKVMEIYINSVHLGNGKDGFQAASYYYFDQPVENLNLSKITALVAAIPNPCIYNGSAKECKILTKEEVAKNMNKSKNIVINTMLDSKFISQKEAEEAKQEKIAEADLHLSMSQNRLGTQLLKSNYFQTQINNLIKQSKKSHLIVLITLDTKKQAASDKVLQDTIATKGNEYNFKQGAIITLNSSNGEMLAITDDYRSTIAERASGSTFKLFNYLAALENNISPDKYFDCSATRGVSGCRSGAKKMNMFEGFARSENVIAIRVAESAGLGNVVKLAKNLGVSTTTTEDDAVNLFLGGQNTKVIDMAKAYAAVVNRGAYYDIPKTIVAAQECNNLEDKKSCQPIQLANPLQSPPRQVVKPENADLMVAMMRGVVETGGTGTLADIPYKYVVGKTGTTDNARDLWFIGALPQENLLVAVWIGNDVGNTNVSNSGGEIAAQVWKDYMLMIEKP